MEIPLEPWHTPNYVHLKMPPRKKEEGFQESPSFHISTVEPEILSQMCDDFRAEIFKKAEKVDPRIK